MISFSGVLPLKAALLLNPTFPELCVRSVDTQVTEAALEDMLDSILGAGALIQRLHRLLLRQTNRKKLNYSLWCFGLFWSLVSSVTQTSHWWCWPHFTIIVYPFPDQHLLSQANSKCPTSVHSRVKNTADWHFLVMPVSHRLGEWTGDELVENSSTTSTFSFLKSAGDTTFMWLTSKLEMTYKRTTSYLSLFSPKSSKCVTLK